MAEGARTTAALAASRFGPVLKVSEDGLISVLRRRPGLGPVTAASLASQWRRRGPAK